MDRSGERRVPERSQLRRYSNCDHMHHRGRPIPPGHRSRLSAQLEIVQTEGAAAHAVRVPLGRAISATVTTNAFCDASYRPFREDPVAIRTPANVDLAPDAKSAQTRRSIRSRDASAGISAGRDRPVLAPNSQDSPLNCASARCRQNCIAMARYSITAACTFVLASSGALMRSNSVPRAK